MILNKENIDTINPPGNKPIRWVAIQTLIGGNAFGAEAAFGCPPLCTIDFDGIDKGNSAAYVHYMNNVRNLGMRQLVLDGDLLSKAKTFKTQEDTDFFNSINHDIDVVSAVPICSGLSMANCNNSKEAGTKARGSDAIQNNNMIGCTEFALQVIKPKAYIFENAPNFFSGSGKGIRDKLTEIGRNAGYSVTYVKTNTYKHENPQHRSRTFGIFWKGDRCPKLDYVDRRSTSILEYLGEIAKDSPYSNDNLYKDFENDGFVNYMKSLGPNWQKIMEEDKCVSIMTYIEKNKLWDAPKPFLNKRETHDVDHAREKVEKGMNYMDGSPLWYDDNRICTIFSRTTGRLIHPSGTRGYTIREALKFMGMPDDFEYPALKDNLFMIGQNVPAVTSMDWHLQIRDFVEGKKEMTDECLQMFNNESGPKPEVKKAPPKPNFGFKLKK